VSRGDRRGKKPAAPAAKGKTKTKTKAKSKANAEKSSAQPHSARARRTRAASAGDGVRTASFVFRHRVGNGVIALVLVVAAAQLFTLQGPKASGLRAEAAGQLKVTDVEEAVRGSIVDRNDDKLAFTIAARALTFQPARIQKQLADEKAKKPDAPEPQARLREIAAGVSGLLNNKPDNATLLKKLSSKDSFVYLARAVGTSRHPTVSRRVAGRQHRRRHRLGRTRPAGTRGLA